jgi:hypothetical protein
LILRITVSVAEAGISQQNACLKFFPAIDLHPAEPGDGRPYLCRPNDRGVFSAAQTMNPYFNSNGETLNLLCPGGC